METKTKEAVETRWTEARLEDITKPGAKILYGILQPGPDIPDGVPYVRPTEMDRDEIILDQIRRTTPAIAAKYKRSLLEEGDVLLSIVGTIGKVAIVPKELEGGNITQSSVRIRAGAKLTSDFLAWYLRSPSAVKQYDAARLGTAVPRLNVAHVRDLVLPIPPLPEQRRIVSAIELQLGRLDAAVARLHAAKAKLKRYKQAVLKAAYTENDWPVTSIGTVYEVFVGSTPSRAKPALWNGNVPWVSSGEVAFCEIHETREKIAHEALNNSEKRLHPSGTVMLAMIGEGKTRGQAAILRIAAAHNQNTAAIRMPDSLHSPEYLYYFFLYEYENTRRVGSGNNQMALNKSRIQDIEIPMPDPETQARIALEIAGRLDEVDAMESTLDAQLSQSTRLRQAVLKRAFEGRLV